LISSSLVRNAASSVETVMTDNYTDRVMQESDRLSPFESAKRDKEPVFSEQYVETITVEKLQQKILRFESHMGRQPSEIRISNFLFKELRKELDLDRFRFLFDSDLEGNYKFMGIPLKVEETVFFNVDLAL